MFIKRFSLGVALLAAVCAAPVAYGAATVCQEDQKNCHGECIPLSQVCCPAGQRACNGACILNEMPCAGRGEMICNGEVKPANSICLMEPPPGVPTVIGPHENAWEVYVNRGIWNWAIGVGIGLAVLNGTVAGFQIMIGQGSLGKERFIWSVVGLILLMFAGVILNFLNPNAFQPVI